MTRWQTRFLQIAVGVGALGFYISDWPTGLASVFWGRHPVLAALLGDLVLIAVSALIVSAVVEKRKSVKRRHVMFMAHDDLANQYNLARRLLLQLSGCLDFDRRATRPLRSKMSGKLGGILDRYFAPRYSGEIASLEERLKILILDSEWRDLVNAELQARQVAWRSVLAAWAPTMLPDKELGRVLIAASEHNRSLSLIQVPILEISRDSRDSELTTPALIEAWKALESDFLVEMQGISEYAHLNTRYDSGTS